MNKLYAAWLGTLLVLLVVWLGASAVDFSGLWPDAIETLAPLVIGGLTICAASGGALLVRGIWTGRF